MKLTGTDVFDATIDRTNDWLHDLMRELNWTDRRKSYLALRSVLHGLRDHLTIEQAVRFGNQLPMLIRGFYFEDWDLAGKPLPWESREDLLAGICKYFNEEDIRESSEETIVRGVFRFLDQKVTEGEIEDFHNALPADLQDLWPSTLRAA